jgi:two-component system alkaline phosphatase synthesis response regulator PhoP
MALLKILIIAREIEQIRVLVPGLAQKGFSCLVAPYGNRAIEQVTEESPKLIFLDIGGATHGSGTWELPQRIKQETDVPIIALISRGMLDDLDSDLGMDDFVVKPWDLSEVIARIKRVLRRTNNINNGETIKCSDLVIDEVKCQVSLSGRLIMLTFREYQLLKFLAGNQGKVFTRETLLNKVWGWDYYGGDRTVDVHVRRLRSKIEDRNHSFIETVRNMGYRFKENTELLP